jgi:hypothetical protein
MIFIVVENVPVVVVAVDAAIDACSCLSIATVRTSVASSVRERCRQANTGVSHEHLLHTYTAAGNVAEGSSMMLSV